MTTPLPDKQFFKIGEVAELVGVKAHVLRYWETEIVSLKPLKTRGAHRMYRREDVDLLCLVRRLLHEEGYTLSGAKRRLRTLQGERRLAEAMVETTRELHLRAELLQVRRELSSLLATFDHAATAAAVERPRATAVVTAVVAKTVLIQPRAPERRER